MSSTLLGPPARFEGGLHEVADGIWAWLQPNGGWGESNAALVAGDDEALLVDTLWDPRLAGRMADAMYAALGGTPVTRVFNTHGDGDHCWGNQLFAGRPIVATEAAVAQMSEESPSQLARVKQLAPVMRRVGSLPLPVLGRLPIPLLPRVPARRRARRRGPPP